jgi:hypothetical protein
VSVFVPFQYVDRDAIACRGVTLVENHAFTSRISCSKNQTRCQMDSDPATPGHILSFDMAYPQTLIQFISPESDDDVDLMTCKNYTEHLIMIKQKLGVNNQTAAIIAQGLAHELKIDDGDLIVEIGERHLDALVEHGTVGKWRKLSRFERVSQRVATMKETLRSGCVYTGVVCRALCRLVVYRGVK